MIIAVCGLWHLGSVTAACLAAAGHDVIAVDPDASTIAKLRDGVAPVAEPGLAALLREHRARIELTTDANAVARAELVWITYDTPVDANDRADVEVVLGYVDHLLAHLREDAVVLVSSQLPVGSIRRLESMRQAQRPDSHISFAYSPENLRLGRALEVFTNPDRVVVGVRPGKARAIISTALSPITSKIEWMSVESAEMTKHAINSFLAVSVTFANELATLCERVGADAKEVERGLKTESRIGPRAYVSPGAAFAGGTLARDVAFLTQLGETHCVTLPLLEAVRPSNQAHKQWAMQTLARRLHQLDGAVIAVLGLTYKPGTDTLRRSAAVELCQQLASAGARVQAWDPAVRALPPELAQTFTLASGPQAAVDGAVALVIATDWPELRELDLGPLIGAMKRRIVIDANRFLASALGDLAVEYYSVGVGDHG